jgi:hypothetical protein
MRSDIFNWYLTGVRFHIFGLCIAPRSVILTQGAAFSTFKMALRDLRKFAMNSAREENLGAIIPIVHERVIVLAPMNREGSLDERFGCESLRHSLYNFKPLFMIRRCTVTERFPYFLPFSKSCDERGVRFRGRAEASPLLRFLPHI